MNALIKSGFLDQIFQPRNAIVIDYDFRNVSYTGIAATVNNTGYLIFNQENGIDYQYSGSKIYDFNNPALSICDTGSIFKGVVSGNFNGETKLKILGNLNATDWTIFTAFKHLETGFPAASKVISD